MNKTLIALVLAAAIPTAVFADKSESGMHKRGPEARMERLAEKLDLTDEQKTRLEVLFEERRAQRQAMRAKMHADMAEVLDDEQMAKMQEMRSKRGEHRKNHRGKRHHNKDGGMGHHKHDSDNDSDDKSSS